MKEHVISALRDAYRRWPSTLLPAVVLAMGVAAALPISAAIYGLLFARLPVPRPSELVELTFLDRDGAPAPLSGEQVEALRQALPHFAGVLGATSATPRELAVGAAKLPVQVQFVTPRFFATLEVNAAAGRLFADADRASRVAVISNRLWTRLGRDTPILGRPVLLGGRRIEILGVAEPGFSGDMAATDVDLWLPAGVFGQMLDLPFPPNSPMRFLHCLGRARTPAPAADREIRAALARLRSGDLGLFREFTSASASPAPQGVGVVRSRTRWYVLLLGGLAVIALGLCAAITSTLFYVGYLERSADFAVKLAVGASNRSIALEVATHALVAGVASVLLAAVLDLALADAIARALSTLDPALARAAQVPAAPLSILLAAAPSIALLAALPAVVSAWRLSAEALVTTSPAARRISGRAQYALLAVQFAVCIAGLYVSTLFLRSAHTLMTLDPGFELGGRYRTAVELSPKVDPAARRRLQQAVLTELRELPAVRAAAWASEDFLNGTASLCCLSGGTQRKETGTSSLVLFVTPSFFGTLGARILSGRDFEAREVDRSDVAIINQALSHRLFGTPDGTGQVIRLSTGQAPRALRVIATVGDMRFFDAHRPPEPTLYLPSLGSPLSRYLYVWDAAHDRSWETVLLRRLGGAAGSESMARPVALRSVLVEKLGQESLLLRVSAGAGALTLLLIVLGLNALIRRFCAERAREIAIRRAVGASTAHVAVFLLRRFGMATATGTASGLLMGGLAAHMLRGAFFEVAVLDWRALSAVVILAAVVNVIAAMPVMARIAAAPLRNGLFVH